MCFSADHFREKQLFCAVALCFAVQAEDIIAHRHEQHLRSNVLFAAREEAAERIVLLDHGENALCLNRAVHPQQLSFWRDDFLAGSGALLQERFGYVDRSVRIRMLRLKTACAVRAAATIFALIGGDEAIKPGFALAYMRVRRV